MIHFNNLQGRTEKLGYWIVFLVGMHSVLLGLVIYFFTDFFYKTFFAAAVENLFFVRQSGVFLFLAGLFYLYPLLDLKKLYSIILLVIFSKFIAVLFLVMNANLTLSPSMVYLAAFFDGLMGLLLILAYFNCRKNFSRAKVGMLREGQYVMTEK